MFKADMHMHSTCSDGTFSPSELLHAAKKEGLSAISITDHDTLSAYTPELFEEAKRVGLELCSGVEFSCRHSDRSVHLLAYAFDPHAASLLALCSRHQSRRSERNRLILKKLRKKGFIIEESELLERAEVGQTIGRPHIAQLMLEKKYVSSIREAFNQYIGDGKSCYDPGDSFEVRETIDIVHGVSGKVFIAHPHLLNEHRIIAELLKLNWDGIECYYSQFSQADNQLWVMRAEERGWMISGGSDFHGNNKEHNRLGSAWIDERQYRRILT